MTEGVLKLSRPVLSATTVIAIEKRMVIGPTATMIARRAAVALVKPRVTKFIPYVGWAIAIGSALYAGYEAYNDTAINWAKMEAGNYDKVDMVVFRMGYKEAEEVFFGTKEGDAARQNKWKYILIPSEAMPMIAAVDTIGMQQYGQVLQWDPANNTVRRQRAIRGLPPAGPIQYLGGTSVRGS